MKKISIITLTFLATLILSGCGSDGSSSSSTASVNTIEAGVTKTLTAGTVISTYSGTCTTSITVDTAGNWSVKNISTDSNDICQYSN